MKLKIKLYRKNKKIIKILNFILITIILSIFSIFSISQIVNSDSISWSVNIDFNSSDGSGDSIFFGEALDANDGPPRDIYDTPHSPAPPEPYIYAWFDDGLPVPFDKLRKDYREYPDLDKTWNLTVFWFHSSSTTVTISWSTSEVDESEYNSVFLYKDGIQIKDMLTQNIYSYTASPMSLETFQIICYNNSPPYNPNNPNPGNDATNVNIDAYLSWDGGDPDGDPVTYDVYFGTISPPPKQMSNQSSNTYDPGTIDYDQIYNWKIVAWDILNASSEGSEWNFTTRSQYIPSAPTGFIATAVSRTQINLSWTPGAMADSTYIERNSLKGWSIGTGVEVYNSTGSIHSDTSLSEGTHYFYQAWSWNNTDHVYSTSHDEANDTTPTNLAPVISFEVPADDSINIEITQAIVNVTIEDPEGDPIDWTIEGIYVNDASGLNESNGSKQASLIIPLPFDTSIVWYVNASDGTNFTNVVYDFTTRSQYVPDEPTALTATAVSRTQIDLSWTPGAMADTTYIERYSLEDWTMGTGTEIYNGSGGSHLDSGLTEGTQYFYQAWSWNNTDLVYSTSHDEANDTTPTNLAPVISFEVPADDSTNIDISQATVNVTIEDPEGNQIDWFIDGLYVNYASGTDEANGSKQATLIASLPYATSILWHVNASDGADFTDVVYDFTTRSQYVPGIPTGFTANNVSRTQIDLSWTSYSMADKTYIERNNMDDWIMGSGIEIYNGSGNSFSDTNLFDGTQYFYQAWSWNNTDHVYSSSYAETNDITTTNLAPVLSFEDPINGSTNVNISQATVNVTIEDPEGDQITWSIEGLYVNDVSGTDEANGSKQATLLVPLPYATSILWYVNISDGYDNTTKLYSFNTKTSNALKLEPIDDSYTSARNKNKNYGNYKNLITYKLFTIKNYIWFKFDLRTLQNNNITSAKLYLHVKDGWKIPIWFNIDIGIHFSSDDTWSENTITWENQPNFNEYAEDTFTNPSSYDIIEFNVTQITKEEITGNKGNGYLTLVIKSEAKWLINYLITYSKECNEISLRPYLEIK